MAGGQAMDCAAPGGLRGAKRRLHRAKSSVLPAFALSAGAVTAGAGPSTCAGLAAFGRGLGWAYQILDDHQDLDEDARVGRGPAGPPRVSHSARIMRQAYRRLGRIPALSDDGLEVLVGLAARVVPASGAQWRADDGTRARSA
jgi:hypothetical protein